MAVVPVTSNKWYHSDTVLKYVSHNYKIRAEYRDMRFLNNDPNTNEPGDHWYIHHYAYTPDSCTWKVVYPIGESPLAITGETAKTIGEFEELYYPPNQEGFIYAGGIDWIGHGGSVVLTFGHCYGTRHCREFEYPGYVWRWICQGGKVVAVFPRKKDVLGTEGGIRGCSKIAEGRYIVVGQQSQNGDYWGNEGNSQGLEVFVSTKQENFAGYNYSWERIGILDESQGVLFNYCLFNSAGTQCVFTLWHENLALSVMTIDIVVPEPNDFPEPDSAEGFQVIFTDNAITFPGITVSGRSTGSQTITQIGEAVIAVDYKTYPKVEASSNSPEIPEHEEIVYCTEKRNSIYTINVNVESEIEVKSIGSPGDEDYESWTETTTTASISEDSIDNIDQGFYFSDPEMDMIRTIENEYKGTNISMNGDSFVTTRVGEEDVYNGNASGQEVYTFLHNILEIDLRYNLFAHTWTRDVETITGGLYGDGENIYAYESVGYWNTETRVFRKNELIYTNSAIYGEWDDSYTFSKTGSPPGIRYNGTYYYAESFLDTSETYSKSAVLPPSKNVPKTLMLIGARDIMGTGDDYEWHSFSIISTNEDEELDPYPYIEEFVEDPVINPEQFTGFFTRGLTIY